MSRAVGPPLAEGRGGERLATEVLIDTVATDIGIWLRAADLATEKETP